MGPYRRPSRSTMGPCRRPCRLAPFSGPSLLVDQQSRDASRRQIGTCVSVSLDDT